MSVNTDRPTTRSYEDVWRGDRGTPPAFLIEEAGADLGNAPVSKTVFTSPEWHELEKEKLWKRTWQQACRENDIPSVGDQLAYDIVDQSVIVVRVGPEEIRAYHNVCRHRGTRLLDGCINAGQIQCSFHGFTWSLDGSLKKVPCESDFPELQPERMGLVEVATATWNGWVFINLDPNAGSFEEFLGPDVRNQFERWPLTRAWKAGHVGKVVPCNWKAALEAFLEAWHTVKTHPEILPYTGDSLARYDHYGPHGRLVSPLGITSPHLDALDDQDIVDAMIGDAFAAMFSDQPGGLQIPQVGPGQKARDVVSDFVRQTLTQATGKDFSSIEDISDVEVLDAIQYFVFPNFVPWGGYAYPIAYRVRPHGDDPGQSLFEVMILVPMPDGAELPPDAQLRITPSDEAWSDAPELVGLGAILDQDQDNLVKLQRGLQSDGLSEVHYSNYMERNLRNFHDWLRRSVEA